MELKTLLYRDIPVPLYDFYVHLNVGYGRNSVTRDKVQHLLEISNNLIITGTYLPILRHVDLVNTGF